MKVIDAGQQTVVGRMRSVWFVSVAALCCCTWLGCLTLQHQLVSSCYGCRLVVAGL
jgi:hypothetical protein